MNKRFLDTVKVFEKHLLHGNEHSLARNIGHGNKAILRGNALEIRNEELGHLGTRFGVKAGEVRELMAKILATPDLIKPKYRGTSKQFSFDRPVFLDWLDKPYEYLQDLKSLAPINEYRGGKLGYEMFHRIRNDVHIPMTMFFKEMARLRSIAVKEGRLDFEDQGDYARLLDLEPKVLRLLNILHVWHSTYSNPNPGSEYPLTFRQFGSHLSVMDESMRLADGRSMYGQNDRNDTGIPKVLRQELMKKTQMDHSGSCAKALTA